MIFTDLQRAVVERLLWDAYFTEPGKTVACIAEASLSLAAEWQKAISKLGTAVIVATPAVLPTERVDLVRVSLVIGIAEFVQVNRAKGGAQKTAPDVGVKAMALLRNWSPDVDIWAAFQLGEGGLSRIGEDDAGCDHWALSLDTFTMLDVYLTLIGTESGQAIGDQDQSGLIHSPTAA